MSVSVSGPDGATLHVDPAVITGWCRSWFGRCNRGFIEVAWTEPNQSGPNKCRHFSLDQMVELGRFVAELNTRENVNVYFLATTTGRSDNHRSSDADVIQAPGLWLDQDNDEHVAAGRGVESIFQPTWWCITGKIPNLRRHGYFTFAEPISDLPTLHGLLGRLITLYQSDATVQNPARLMRMPGTIAWPWKRMKQVAGRQAEMTELVRNPACRMDTYAIGNVMTLLPPQVTKTAALPATGVMPAAEPIAATGNLTYDQAILALQSSEEGRWRALLTVVGSLVSKNLTDDLIIGYLTQDRFNVVDHKGDLQTPAEWYDTVERLVRTTRARFEHPYVGDDGLTTYGRAAAAFEGQPLPPAPTSADNELFGFLRLNELVALHGEPPVFLIDKILARGQTCLISGLPGAGKSPIVQSWCAALLAGVAWDGRPVTPCNVVYIAAESENQTALNISHMLTEMLRAEGAKATVQNVGDMIEGRFLAMTAVRPDGTNNPVFFIEKETDRLVASLEAQCSIGGDFHDQGTGEPDLIVFDTLRAMSVGSVNKDEDMALVQEAVNLKLRRRFPRAAVIIITHAPKGDPEGSTGSNRLAAMAENIWSVGLIAKDADANGSEYVKSDYEAAYGPDRDGFTYKAMRLKQIRAKAWQGQGGIKVAMKIKESNVTIHTGADILAINFDVAVTDPAVGYAAPQGPPGADHLRDKAQAATIEEAAENAVLSILAHNPDGATIADIITILPSVRLTPDVQTSLRMDGRAETHRKYLARLLAYMKGAGYVTGPDTHNRWAFRPATPPVPGSSG